MRFIALLGNPNAGKTTLFNELTGSKQHVGNWPGVTVEKKEGKLKNHKNDVTIVDLPGIYSLSPYTLEEVVSRDYIIKEKPSAIINIIDSTNLERNLYLTSQAIETGVPVVIALNMMDLIEKRGLKIDIDELSKALGGIPVVPISALENQGLDKLVDEALKLDQVKVNASVLNYGESVEKAISEIEEVVGLTGDEMRYHAIKLIENDKRVKEDLKLSPEVVKKVEAIVADLEDELDNDGETIITNSRYDFIGAFMPQVMTRPKTKENLTRTDRIDAVVTNRCLALPIFGLVMFVVYYIAITAIGGPSQDWVGDYLVTPFSDLVTKVLTDAGASEWVIDMLVNGAIAGVGAVITFVPQLMLLYFFLSFLEGCGYMSRIAFIMDRIFRRFGLSGKSFIPFLMATGCALILSTFFVRFRDLSQIWEVVLQAGLYATPIIYPITFIADRNPWAAKLVMMNPLAQIIQDMRYFLIDKANTPVWLLVENKFLVLVPYVLPILIFLAGFAYFNKHAKKFAEIL